MNGIAVMVFLMVGVGIGFMFTKRLGPFALSSIAPSAGGIYDAEAPVTVPHQYYS